VILSRENGANISRENSANEEGTTMETIRENPALENIPIIVFTGNTISRTEENPPPAIR